MESLELDPSWWKDKRVFVTGHTGFKGSWLTMLLEVLGARVTGFALDCQTQPSLFELAGLATRVTDLRDDVRDRQAVSKALQQADPEMILHMAAQPLVRESYQDPVGTFETNVMGTVHVLEAARHCPSLRAIVNVTTDKCYENVNALQGYRETDPLGGHDPYSASKACSELVTASYRRSFFSASQRVGVASARAGNVIGGGDWAVDRLVPDCLAALSKGQPIYVRNPNAVRPWQHVLEPLRGYLTLLRRLWDAPEQFGEGWNFGPADSDAQPVRWIAEQMAQQWGAEARIDIADGPHPHEAQFLRLDCSKAKSRLGWEPWIGLSQALAWTVDWHRQYLAGADVYGVSIEQIRSYIHRKDVSWERPAVDSAAHV